jgi:hypothetical protein
MMMYQLAIDGYAMPSGRADGRWTLVEAMAEARGCAGATVWRTDGTIVVRYAGSTELPWMHVPTGRVIRHRLTPWAKRAHDAAWAEWCAGLDAARRAGTLPDVGLFAPAI